MPDPDVLRHSIDERHTPPLTTHGVKTTIMKKIVIASTLSLLFVSTATFAGTQDCATRISAIQTQIQNAKQWGNVNQVAGLERSLANVQANCTNAGQLERAERNVQDKQEDVRKAQAEVADAADKLRDAQSRGDAKKIKSAQEKLADKQDKLSEKMDKLRIAQADLAGLKG